MYSIKTHKVKPGDTLSGIIKKYYGAFDNAKLKMVMDFNGIQNPNLVYVGRVVKLPGNWGGSASAEKPPIKNIPHAKREIVKLTSKSEPSETPSYKAPKTVQKELPEGDYWQELYHKNLIILHFTAGYSAMGAYETFLKPGRVATPFIVEKNGDIYQLFDEKYWSYHLGVKGNYSENWKHDKRSIGIEIVNIGPAWRLPDVGDNEGIPNWRDYVGKVYDKSHVVEGKNRDADGGFKFPDAQVLAVASLVNWLCAKYDIPRLQPTDFMKYQLPAVGKFNGVAAHQNFRKDKYDMGAAWPVDKFGKLCGLKAVEL